MPQEDRVISTGREAVESLSEDYIAFCTDPDMSFRDFAGDVLDIFEAAPDAAFAYDAQIHFDSIERLPEPGRETLLDLCGLASRRLMDKARRCTDPHDMVRYALAAEWIDHDHAELVPFLTARQRGRITVALARNDRDGAAEVLAADALDNVTTAHGPVRGHLEQTVGDDVTVTDAAGATRTVRIGSIVTLDESDGTRFRFRVAAVAESNPGTGTVQSLIDETAVDHPMNQATWAEWPEQPGRDVVRLEHRYSSITVDLPRFQVEFDDAGLDSGWHGPAGEVWPAYDWSSTDNDPDSATPDPSCITCIPGLDDGIMPYSSGPSL